MLFTKKSYYLILILTLSFVVILSGCGSEEASQDGNGEQSTAENNQNGGNNETSEETIELSFGHWLTPESPQGKQFEYFAELVNERTDGAVMINVFPNGQLGDQRDLLEGVQAGTVDMAKADDAYLSSYIPEYGLFSLPFIFEGYEHLGKVLDSDITKQLDEKLLEETGVRSLGWSFGGFRYFITKDKVTGPDFDSAVIRAPESDVYIDTINALNASATPMAWGEIYTALETGVIDGLESAPSDLYLQNFYEVTNYLLATNHIQASATTIINENKWNEIPEEYQSIMIEALNESIEIEREETETVNMDAVEKMVEAGLEVVEVEDRQAFVDAVDSVWEKAASEIDNGDELIEQIVNLK